MDTRPRECFTVDVEEWFQVLALSPYVPMSRWASFESRVEAETDRLLELMAASGAHGTFFTLGWVAERHPGLLRRIVDGGHELASHTYDHRRVTEQDPASFRDSLRRTKAILEDIGGQRVLGFRAPSFSIVHGTEWALDVLLEEGHEYDSSLFPVRRPGYGYVGGGRAPYWIERVGGRLAEFPPATLQFGGLTLPAGGGAYFRLLPPVLVHTALRRASDDGAPGVFYVHPWEWDPDQPHLDVPLLTRIRHYGGQAGVFARLRSLLKAFQSVPIRDALAELRAADPVPSAVS